MPAPDLRRDKPPTQPGMRPASYLPATASAPSLTAAARPEKTKFPGWLPSFRRLDATRHPMDLPFLVQASLPAHFPARHVRSRTKFENKRLLSSPIPRIQKNTDTSQVLKAGSRNLLFTCNPCLFLCYLICIQCFL